MTQQKPVLQMINKYNIADLSLADRPVQGTREGFGAVIVNHPAHHGQRYFATENRTHFGGKEAMNPEQTVAAFAKDMGHSSGGQHRPMEQQKVKTLSNLTGEIYNSNYDPQGQTDVQRSWMYQKDPSLRAVNANYQKDQVNFYDNANSLPMGEGVWNTRKFSDKPGANRHFRSDITINATKNPLISKK